MLNVQIPELKKINGSLRTVSTPYGYAVSEGNIEGHSTKRITGFRAAMSNGTYDDISGITAVKIPIPASAITLEVVGNAADAAAGAGAHKIEVYGLGAQFEEQSESVIMAGAGAVALVKSYIRVNRMNVTAAGSNKVATGPIILRATGGGTEYMQISASTNVSGQCHFTVPANHVAYLVGWSAGSTGSKPTRLDLVVAMDPASGKVLDGIYGNVDTIVADSAFSYKPLPIPIRCPPKCDIKIRGLATGAGASCSGAIELWIEKE